MNLGWGNAQRLGLTTVSAALLLLLPACERNPAPQGSAAGAAVSADSKLLVPESAQWTAQQAAQQLAEATAGRAAQSAANAKLAVSAAVRLVRLAKLEPLCVGPAVSDEICARLRVARVGERWRVLGLVARATPHRLQAPVWLEANGTVTPIGTGVLEELTLLRISKDPRIFPHLLVQPERVYIISTAVDDGAAESDADPNPDRDRDPDSDRDSDHAGRAETEAGTATIIALQLEPNQPVWFECREKSGFGYISLRVSDGVKGREIARYIWDPDEGMFTGPAADALPEPPGGKFSLDIEASERLVPMGGQLPEPKEAPQTPSQQKEPSRHRPPGDLPA